MNRNFLYLLVFLGYSFINTYGVEKLQTKPGRSVKMKCPKNGKTERLIWFYRKDNTSKEDRVQKSKNVQIQSNDQEDILILTNPTYSDEGFYVLRQVGQENHARCQTYLEILSAPTAHCSPSPQINAEKGSDVTLTCTAGRGNPKPLPTWYRVEGSSANIKPEVEVYESIIELRDSRNATLMCRVTANPMSVVMWTRDNNTEQLYENHLYDIKVDDELLKTHYTKYVILTLNAVTLKDNMFGVYWCRITGYGEEYARKVKVVRITDDN